MNKTIAIAAVVLVAAGLGAGYWLGGQHARTSAAPANPAAAVAPGGDASGRKILYWQDPMYPQHRFDKPGRSPFMNMELVPVYADQAASDEGGVKIAPGVQQRFGVRTAVVDTAEFARDLPALGYVAADERRIVQVQSRLAGFVERLAVRAVNDPVRAGQVLAEIYSPEWYGAQQEFLFAQKLARADPGDEPLARAARQRLLLFGLPESEVAKIERSGAAQRRFPLVASTGGVLSELAVREGQAVAMGMPMFTISDLSSVWITVEVPERQAGALREGVGVKASIATLPGKVFEGRIDYLYPQVNTQTRTLKARATLANPRLELKPGMLAEVTLATPARKVLAVPSEAVIQTGTRMVVIVAEGDRFRPVTVQTGPEVDGRTEVLKGLKQGERVVVSGQFLIDSESSLRTTLARLDAGGVAPQPAASGTHRGVGRVTSITPAKGQLELAHEPIPSMNWPAMEMGFVVEDRQLLKGLKRGDTVEFELLGEPDKDGEFVIRSITPRAAAPAPPDHGSHK